MNKEILNAFIDVFAQKYGQLLKEGKKPPKNRREFIEFFKNTPKKDGRHTARKDEIERLEKIIQKINDPSNQLGQHIRKSYEETFNKTILSVTNDRSGSNNDHQDFIINHTDGTLCRVEEKHCKKINPNIAPWKGSVQVLNGPGNHYSLGKLYSRMWYNNIIVKTNWNTFLKTDSIPTIPSYDEWVKDAFRCGDPHTVFVKAIKREFRKRWPGQSFTGLGGTPDLRSALPKMELSQEDKDTFIHEIQEKMNQCLNEKDCFLQTSGSIDQNNFKFLWRKSVKSPKIKDFHVHQKKDTIFELITEQKDVFSVILRWGKGIGFTNIRLDVR